MPWKETDTVKERVKFVLEWERLFEKNRRSRRPQSNPNAMTLQIEATLIAARKLHPRWGPRKLRAWLQDRFPDHTFHRREPSARC